MTLVTVSKAEQELLGISKATLSERRDSQGKQQQQVASFMKFRKRVASEFKRELFVQVLRTARINAQALADRQSKDQ